MSSVELSTSLADVEIPVGQQMTLQKKFKTEYQTSNGTTVYDKILTGFKPILFPTAVSRNACFEYRFSIKDLMLPRELPQVTDLYFKDLVVKIQDSFTQIMANNSIVNGKIVAYMPYSAVLAQDGNGIETEPHMVNGKQRKFVNTERIIKRDSSPLFVVSSNIKFTKSIDLDIATNSYKALMIYNNYNEDGQFVNKVVKSAVSASVDDLRSVMTGIPKSVEDRKNKSFCIDIILCDILICCLKSFDLTAKGFNELKPSDLEAVELKKSLPAGWLTPEEKLMKFGKKGTFMETFDDGTEIPNSLFQLVDMQSKCDKLFKIARPTETVFEDKEGIIADFVGQYILATELMSLRVKSDN